MNILLDDRENVTFRNKLGESKIYGSEISLIIGDKYKRSKIVEVENHRTGNKTVVKESSPVEIVRCIKKEFEGSK